MMKIILKIIETISMLIFCLIPIEAWITSIILLDPTTFWQKIIVIWVGLGIATMFQVIGGFLFIGYIFTRYIE